MCSRRRRPRRSRGSTGNGGDPLLSALGSWWDSPHRVSPQRVWLAPTSPLRNRTGQRRRSTNPAQRLSGSTLDARTIVDRPRRYRMWFALSGSLPPGVPLGWQRRTCRGAARSPVQGCGRHLGRPADGTRRSVPRLGTRPAQTQRRGTRTTDRRRRPRPRTCCRGGRDPGPAIARRRSDWSTAALERACHARRSRCCPRHRRTGAWIATAPPKASQSDRRRRRSLWPATSSPKREAASIRAVVTRSPTEAPLPPFPAEPPTPEQIDLAAVSVSAADASSPIPLPPNSPDALSNRHVR